MMPKQSRHSGLSYFKYAFAAPKRPKHLASNQVKPALRPTFCLSQSRADKPGPTQLLVDPIQ